MNRAKQKNKSFTKLLKSMSYRNGAQLVTFEGLDKAGKHTQSELLGSFLEHRGYKTFLYDFPRYETVTGQTVREYLTGRLHFPKKHSWHLWWADQVAATQEILKAKETPNSVLIFDRFANSNFAYAPANGADINEMIRLYSSSEVPRMDLVIYLDISAEESLKRKGKLSEDMFEADLHFLEKVRSNYHEQVRDRLWTHESVYVDAQQSVEKISAEIQDQVHLHFPVLRK